MWHIYTMEYYSAIEKDEASFAETWVDLEDPEKTPQPLSKRNEKTC